jgi:hypothetical protein
MNCLAEKAYSKGTLAILTTGKGDAFYLKENIRTGDGDQVPTLWDVKSRQMFSTMQCADKVVE